MVNYPRVISLFICGYVITISARTQANWGNWGMFPSSASVLKCSFPFYTINLGYVQNLKTAPVYFFRNPYTYVSSVTFQSAHLRD